MAMNFRRTSIRCAADRNALRDFILSLEPPNEVDVIYLYSTIIEAHGPIEALLERSPANHRFREAFILNPDIVLPKLCYLLRRIRQRLVPRNHRNHNILESPTVSAANKAITILSAFIKHVAVALATEEHFDTLSDGYYEFIQSILWFYVPFISVATTSLRDIRDLFSRILRLSDHVFITEKLISEESNTRLITGLLVSDSLIDRVFTSHSLRNLGNRISKLIGCCIVSHGPDVENACFLWEKMENIRLELESQIAEIQSQLSIGLANRSIYLDEDSLQFLTEARIFVPTNQTTAAHTIRSLEERYQTQIKVMASSFPCSACKDRLSGEIHIEREDFLNRGQTKYLNFNAPLGVFQVHLSDVALRDLKQNQFYHSLKDVFSVLKRLADGLWEVEPKLSIPTQNLANNNAETSVRAAEWCQDGFILWERGIGRAEDKADVWCQIVKVIRVGFRSDMKIAISAARKTQRAYTEEYKAAASLKIYDPNRVGALIPKTFTAEDGIRFDEGNVSLFRIAKSPKLTVHDELILHKALCTGKQYNLTKGAAEVIVQGGHRAEIPFIVSPEERSIIKYLESSLCILGRSGTGKTTCLVFRLLASYLAGQLAEGSIQVRQVFLTRSPVLAAKIREYIARLINTRFMRFSMEDDIEDLESSELYSDLHDDDIAAKSLLGFNKADWPLVCTFDSFAMIIENSLRLSQRGTLDYKKLSHTEYSNRRVDFGKFERFYWPGFPTLTKKGLTADGVFSEIMGVIKTTSMSSEPTRHTLSLEQYQELSHRVAPNFRVGRERDAVYELYLAYEHRRTQLGEWDDLDRTARIQGLLSQDSKLTSLLQNQITEILVDEIQDQRIPEIEILLDLITDVKSFTFAGDTAQCISRDSCFRFQDLKKLFFQKCERIANMAGQKNLARLELFTLSKNYRTHNGSRYTLLLRDNPTKQKPRDALAYIWPEIVLKFAASVIDMLTTHFPYVIDKLAPELGEFEGPLPIVFKGFSEEIFRRRRADNSSPISEFGADQVVIVRDERAKLSLSKKMGDDVLILTILESKGMEFQDVFLFNFFSTSPCDASFRTLARGLIDGARFDDAKHASLCIELKNLYVAITRAREMLYIIESNPGHALELWDSDRRDTIIDVVTPGDPTFQARLEEIRLGQSNPEQWRQKGNEFLDQFMYEQAIYCYRRAGQKKLQDLCQALLEERNGRDIISDVARSKDAELHYLEAARLFRKCEKYEKALKCFESIKKFSMAGELCEELSTASDQLDEAWAKRAAEYFERGNMILRAVLIYIRLGHHVAVILGYRKLNMVKELMTYLKRYAEVLERRFYKENRRLIAATVFSSSNSNDRLKKDAIALLDESEQEQLYRQFHFHLNLERLLISQNRYEEAVELAYSHGNWEKVGILLEEMTNGKTTAAKRGEDFAHRVLFHQLSSHLSKFRGIKENNGSNFRADLRFTAFAGFHKAASFFQELTESLSVWFDRNPSMLSRTTTSDFTNVGVLRDLLLVQFYLSEHGSTELWSPFTDRFLSVVIRCLDYLWDIQRDGIISEVLLLFIEAIPTGTPDVHDLFKSSILNNDVKNHTQKVTGNELISRTILTIGNWIARFVIGYSERGANDFEGVSICRHFIIYGYCGFGDAACQSGKHVKSFEKDTLLKPLQIAWSMACFASYGKSEIERGMLPSALLKHIRYIGHIWYTRIFNATVLTSDIFQHHSATVFLMEKRFSTIRRRKAEDLETRRNARLELKCFDDLAWRVRSQIRNLRELDIWKLIEAWEKIQSLGVHHKNAHERSIWWNKVRCLDVPERDTIILMSNVERCLRDSRTVVDTMNAFAKNMNGNLSRFRNLGDMNLHLMINKLDRAFAVIIFIACGDTFVLKTSQLEYLRRSRRHHLEFTDADVTAAKNALNSIIGVQNLISERIDFIPSPLWYKEVIRRRIEGNSIIAILNSREASKMEDRSRFIQGYLRMVSYYDFWKKRVGHQNDKLVRSIPREVEGFVRWAIENIRSLESPTDPMLFCNRSSDEKQPLPFRGVNVQFVPFQTPTIVPDASASVEVEGADVEGANEPQISGSDAQVEGLISENINLKDFDAVIIIQRNWRLYRKVLRDRRFLKRDPTHCHITRITQEMHLEEKVMQRFRMYAFSLLEITKSIRNQLKERQRQLELKSGSTSIDLNRMEGILAGYDYVQSCTEQVGAIEAITTNSPMSTRLLSAGELFKGMKQMIAKAKMLRESIWSGA